MDRVEIDSVQVRRLVAEQSPRWSDLPVPPVARSGWDNRTFHLGDAMTVRLPSGVGDPSCDLAIAWNVFRGPARVTFRDVLAADDALWARGIGWALWKALITFDESSAVVEEILAQNA